MNPFGCTVFCPIDDESTLMTYLYKLDLDASMVEYFKHPWKRGYTLIFRKFGDS